jgi:glycosyltransferase involved in cell wall biosynthesis
MAPLEIAAAGRPTIAYRAGGAVETIVEGVTGMFFDQQEPESLAAAIEQFEQVEWSGHALRHHAEKFGVDVFQERMRSFLARIGVNLRDTALPFPLLVGRPGGDVDVEERLLA